uniref:t-SNARE coiled-coil homology domain-containing protein n=1 Tax=Parastrongyloides trichosuri TaxID=131310 RepID=A0A0N4ZPA5_PARTI
MTYNPIIPVTDNTHLFKARMKMICAKYKGDSPIKNKAEKKGKKGYTSKLPLYMSEAKEILKNITLLKSLSLDNRFSYIASSGFYFPYTKKDDAKFILNDKERKKLDMESDNGIEGCQKLVENLKKQVNVDNFLKNDEEKEVIKNIVLLLDNYLNTVRGEIMEMREKYNEKAKKAKFLGSYVNFVKMDQKGYKKAFKDIDEKYNRRHKKESIMPDVFHHSSKEPQKSIVKVNFFEEIDNEENIPEVNDQLLIDNEKFYQTLTNKNEQIEIISRQFAEIEKLQHTFMEKALEQERNIEIIHDKVELTEINLKLANNLIKNALENNASRRVIFMFCIIVLTLTLLFLDWFNP